jgi:hypothetical protein
MSTTRKAKGKSKRGEYALAKRESNRESKPEALPSLFLYPFCLLSPDAVKVFGFD